MSPKDLDVADLSALDNLSIDEIVRKCFAYADIPGTSEREKEDRFRKTLECFPRSKAYGEGLRRLVARHGAEEVANAAGRMLATCHEILRRLQIEVSPWEQSRTWPYWDMGKQYHYLHHPQEADPNYRREDPLSSPKKFQEIVDRHVGWELFNVRSVPTPPLLKAAADRTEIRELLKKTPKPNGTLSSKELALLGNSVRTVLGMPNEAL